MWKCFEGVKHPFFIFISLINSLLHFGSWVNLKVLTLDFELFSFEAQGELETKNSFKFPSLRILRDFARECFCFNWQRSRESEWRGHERIGEESSGISLAASPLANSLVCEGIISLSTDVF